MNKIDLTFQRLKNKGRAALIPFVIAGDPTLEITEALVLKMAECGADIIEIGVPFSDPLADGPTIQAASQRALMKGINIREIFGMTKRLKGLAQPLILMTYFNPIFRYGFCQGALWLFPFHPWHRERLRFCDVILQLFLYHSVGSTTAELHSNTLGGRQVHR